jgi:hypothetical protein
VRDVAAGAEIFNTYGTRSNAILLHMYGFTLSYDPHAVARLDAALLRRALAETASAPACGVGAAAGAPSLRRRLALAAQAGLVASAAMRASDEDGFELSAREPLPRELLLLTALAHAPDAIASEATRLCRRLARAGRVGLPATAAGAPGGATAEEPAEVLWHLLAAGAGPDSRAAPEDGPDAAPPLSAAELARLLPPQAVATLRRALALREGLYPTPSLSDDVAALAQARCSSGEGGDAAAALEAHALQLRVSERQVLASARAILDAHAPSQPSETGDPSAADDAAGPSGAAGRKRKAEGASGATDLAAAARAKLPASVPRTASDDPVWALFD